VQAENLMDGIKGNSVTGKHVNDTFRTAQMAFALELFQRSVEDAEKENMLISPLSVMLALSMTANGATGETKAQMEEVLGLSVKELNEYLYSYIHSLPSDDKAKFGVANSIWFRDGLEVLPSFLQKNADYYGAAAYQSAFDDATVKDINNWVEENTDGLIEKMLDSIDASTVMYLINTVLFDAKWQKEYRKDHIQVTPRAYPGTHAQFP
jgi:serpin B